MWVCEITKCKKHLTKLTLDNGQEILLDNDVVCEACIHEDTSLTEESLSELIFKSDYERAKSRALWYLDRSALTEKALFDKLIKAGFKREASAAVIARFVELGMLDDRRFAFEFARRCAESNISRREAYQKMCLKGVDRELANEALDSLDTDEEAQISELLERKYRGKLITENGVQKVYAALIRKGFSFSAVRNALKKYSEEIEYCEE